METKKGLSHGKKKVGNDENLREIKCWWSAILSQMRSAPAS